MYNHIAEYRVIYGDTDKMGYVYNSNYLRLFEIGRGEMFRSIGLPYKKIESMGFFLPLSEMGCKFMIPVKYDDRIKINTCLDPVIRAGMKFNYTILDETEKIIHAKGFTKHAFVDSNGKVVRPPGLIQETIQQAVK